MSVYKIRSIMIRSILSICLRLIADAPPKIFQTKTAASDAIHAEEEEKTQNATPAAVHNKDIISENLSFLMSVFWM